MWASGQRARLYSHDLSLNPPEVNSFILLKCVKRTKINEKKKKKKKKKNKRKRGRGWAMHCALHCFSVES